MHYLLEFNKIVIAVIKFSFLSSIINLFFRHGRAFSIVLFGLLSLFFVTLLPNGIYYWDVLCVLAFFLFPWKKYIDLAGKWIVLWSFSYGIMLFFNDCVYSSSSIILFFLAPILLYAFGGWFVDKLKCDDKGLIILILTSIISFCFVLWERIILDMLNGSLIAEDRAIHIDGVYGYSATLYGLYAAIAMVGIPLFFTTKRSWKSLEMWLFLSMAVLSILTTIHLMNRTAFVVLALCTIVILIFRSKMSILKLFFFLLIFAFAIYMLDKFGLINDEIIDAYESRNEGSDVATAGERSYRWIDAITRIFYMPFGWYGKESLTGYNYVHNWWLDVARQTGLIPLIALVVPTIISIKTMVVLFFKKESVFVTLLIGLNVSMFCAAFVEPVMEGCQFFAFYYIFIWGVQNRYLKQTKIANNCFGINGCSNTFS